MLVSVLKNLRGAYALAPLRTAKMAINRAAVFMVRLDSKFEEDVKRKHVDMAIAYGCTSLT